MAGDCTCPGRAAARAGQASRAYRARRPLRHRRRRPRWRRSSGTAMAAPPPSTRMNSTRVATATVAPSSGDRPLAAMKTVSRTPAPAGTGTARKPAIQLRTAAKTIPAGRGRGVDGLGHGRGGAADERPRREVADHDHDGVAPGRDLHGEGPLGEPSEQAQGRLQHPGVQQRPARAAAARAPGPRRPGPRRRGRTGRSPMAAIMAARYSVDQRQGHAGVGPGPGTPPLRRASSPRPSTGHTPPGRYLPSSPT